MVKLTKSDVSVTSTYLCIDLVPEISDFGINWIRFAPNGTKLGCFVSKIRFRRVKKTYLKRHRLDPLGADLV